MGTLKLLLCFAFIGSTVATTGFIKCNVASSGGESKKYDCIGSKCVYYKDVEKVEQGCWEKQYYPVAAGTTVLQPDSVRLYHQIFEIMRSSNTLVNTVVIEPTIRDESNAWNSVFNTETLATNVCYKSKGREFYICDTEECNIRCDSNMKTFGVITFIGCLIAWIMQM
uniref:CX domain-containing protein n=1 Tax=Panagrellus redivivus TaxID=6233 RepID=A0A7E4UZZ0_PANRE